MEANTLYANLFSPPVLAFAAGVIAVIARSDLKIPDQIYQGLAIYLLFAIGFKGGVSLGASGIVVALPAVGIAVALGVLISAVVFFVSKILIFKEATNAAALAAHYGSISAVTFMACMAFLDARNVVYESYLPAVMALMEAPAIVAAIVLARVFQPESRLPLSLAVREALAGKSVFLLLAGLAIGFAAGPSGAEKASPFLVQPFYGVLILFLLEMGLTAGNSFKSFTSLRWKLATFAAIAPLLQGALGILGAKLIGLSVGGATLLATLAASASYIAAPAAVRIALPNANPSYYVFTSLGVTFPLNLTLGIPLYYLMAHAVCGD